MNSTADIRRTVTRATVVVACMGLVAELAGAAFTGPAVTWAVEMFSLSYEGNLPTWYASSLLLCCALVAARCAAVGADRRAWRSLSALFVLMSVDEAVELHEHLYLMAPDVVHFSWVIPGAALAAVVGGAFVPFLLRLPRHTRNACIVAGALYLGGVLALELPLGWWAKTAGTDNLGYAIIDWIEETLELTGATVFVVAAAWYREDAE